MAKLIKKEDKKIRPTKYQQKLVVGASFIEIIKTSAKHAESGSVKKKS